jgi:hypothetical protein
MAEGIIRAIPELVDLLEEGHHLPGRPSRGKRAKIPGTVPLNPTDILDPGIVLVHLNPQIGVGFVVLEPDVELGLVFFDEGALEKQGFGLGFSQDHFEPLNAGNQHFGPEILMGSGLEIAAEAVLQVFGLAHIKKGSLNVSHQVDSGGGRNFSGHLQ